MKRRPVSLSSLSLVALAAAYDRATSIGAQLCISSQPGRSMVEISLP